MRMEFEFEGTFRHATVTKGCNRDTGWFAMTDQTWPHMKNAVLSWLNANNLDSNGRQIRQLQDCLPHARNISCLLPGQDMFAVKITSCGLIICQKRQLNSRFCPFLQAKLTPRIHIRADIARVG